MDDDCHDTNTVFKDEMKIDKPKPEKTPVNPQVKGLVKMKKQKSSKLTGTAAAITGPGMRSW